MHAQEGAAAQVMAAVHQDYASGGLYVYNDKPFDKEQIEGVTKTHDPEASLCLERISAALKAKRECVTFLSRVFLPFRFSDHAPSVGAQREGHQRGELLAATLW